MYERRALEVIQAGIPATSDVRTARSAIRAAHHLFNAQSIETRILRVQPDPRSTIKRLARVNVSAAEMLMKEATQIVPATFIDRRHQAGQERNSIHSLRIRTHRESAQGSTKMDA